MSTSTDELTDRQGGSGGQERRSARGRLRSSLTPPPRTRATATGRPGARRRLLGAGAAVAGVAVLALLPLLDLRLPGVLPTATYQPGALQLMALCLLMGAAALTYHLLIGVAGLLSFGHALYVGAGSYLLGILLERTGLGLVPAMLVTLVAVVVLANVTGAVALRVSGIPFAMVTLAFAQAGSVLVRRNPGGSTGGEEGLSLNTDQVPAVLVGVSNTRNLYWLALAVLIVVFAVVSWIQNSRAGHLAEAVRENEDRVRVLGLRPYLAKLLIFVVAGTLAGCVGMVHLLLQSGAVPRTVSADLTISLLVMVVLGGVGSRWGAVLGGVLYTLLDQRLTVLAQSESLQALPAVLRVPLSEPLFLLGSLFVLVVLFLPGGLAGSVRRLSARTGRRRPRRDPAEVLGQAG
ncbi:branched-chain amino acid ABC transporter permease [Citricoccus sp. SGAir0253]|uniref:branched-chain amino acid ABC transporter permease n=1 Tax=Citricoccus sp. SGAir0253 TaxID=2567881 RepID=UPI0010CD6A45|nr:branched-chain amino acid ABC transporter permease [Citricoccus sp. SGAir0253]QCU78459.1 branched-chain amino acid ABC transporter permease [Citricoccus sp. SGAir0253]